METDRPDVIALREAVKIVGSQSAMGRLLGVSQAAVWRWIQHAKPVPPEHVLAVEAATGIAKEELRPDLYRPRDATVSSSLAPNEPKR